MPLRIRILLWVSLLFLVAIFAIFFISHIEINYNLKKEEKNLVEKVKEVDRQNVSNILKYLSLSINNRAEQMYNVFETITTSSQWRLRFLPDPYNVKTRNWGTSGAALATFPWLDFINIQINDDLSAYIRQADPFLNKYVKIQISEDLTIFTTKEDDGCLCAYVGVPFWSNQSMRKYVDIDKAPDFFLAKEPDQWLLYETDELLKMKPNSLQIKNHRLYKHLFDEAVTIHSKEEFEFLFTNLITMLKVTQAKLKKTPDLISILKDKKKLQIFLDRELKKLKPDIEYERDFCIGPLCEYAIHRYPEKPWSTRRNFEHKLTQKKLIWEICMLVRTGVWDYSPFNPQMPIGIVTSLEPLTEGHSDFYNKVTEGFFIKDVFLDKTIQIPRQCKLRTGNPEYDRKIIFGGKKGGVAKSCRNPELKIFYDKDTKEPYLTSTMYITYINPPMKVPNESSITLGVALDPLLINLSLVSPDEVAFIDPEGDIRYYSTDGQVVNITNDNDTIRKQLLTQKSGSITDVDGKQLYFQNLGRITEEGGHIIIIEKEESRTAIINSIGSHVTALSRRVTIHSSILIIISLIIITIILSRVTKAITQPIDKLAEATNQITNRNLNKIELDKSYTKRKDEIGSLYNSFAEMIKAMKEGTKVRGLLDKVVSKQVAEKILNEGITLGGELRTLTVMFCDIRNFTSITENMHPEDVLIMLNECLTLLSAVIDDFEGVIDKYEGDKIMTLFGAPITTDDHALQATLCAIEMQKALTIWNNQREKCGFCKLEVGIGIHTGEAVAGNVGAENHLSYTVLGHIVNLTARICDFAKGQEILVTEETLSTLKDHVEYRENPPEKFKGISSPVITYSILKKK